MKKHLTLALALLTILSTSVDAQLPSYLPTDGLVGWWPFNGNANDESGNGNDGVVNGAVLAADRFGNAVGCYFFDGVNDVITVADNNELRLQSGQFTISLWYKVQSYGLPNRNFIAKTDGPGSTNKWVLQKTAIINGGPNLSFHTNGALGSFFVNGNTVEDYSWHHMSVVYQGSTTKIYEDGNLLQSSSLLQFQTSNADIRIGADEIQGGGHWHHGTLDDIAIYNRALTEQEIQNLYTGTTPAACLDLPANLQDGLVGYWPFCGNANDESGNGNNGTVNGATLAADRFGNAGSAYSFDGVDDFVRCAEAGPLGSSARTITYWSSSNLNSNSLNVMPVSYGSISAGGNEFDIIENLNCSFAIGVDVNLSARTIQSGLTDIQDWHQVTVSFDPNDGADNSVIKYYINGTLIQQACSSAGVSTFNINTLSDEPLTFGRWCRLQGTQSNGYQYNGLLDDITIYNRALTSEEVTQLYAVQSTGDPTAGGGGNTTGPLANGPRGISYQAVARDAQGQVIASSPVNVRFTLHQGTPTGTTEYSETHALTTNEIGLFHTFFGTGTAITSAFDSIVWSNTTKFLQVEIDLGNGYVDMGTQQLMSVPYAYRANEAAAAGTIRNNGLPIYPDNTAALAGGLVAGEMYRTATGDLKIVY